MLPWRVFLPAWRCHHTKPSPQSVRNDLRTLLRETAQPVAVVTSLMPEIHLSKSESHPHSKFHGATLSSFSSIAMDPHPLVAFSLRIPSRMATSLKDAHIDWPSHMVVNILSASQADVAVKFSRVDLHPYPFQSVPYFLSEEGLPVIEGSLGALSCKLVASSWPLHDLEVLRSGKRREVEKAWEGEGVASELFIARVTRVESLASSDASEEDLRTLPLLYHRRGYSTTSEIPHDVHLNRK
ncbi:FMN-binding split barrel [Abortiporus biennis]